MCFNSPELNYTYYCILSSAIQKHLAMVIFSVKRFLVVYCKIHISGIQHTNDISQNVMHIICFCTCFTICLNAHLTSKADFIKKNFVNKQLLTWKYQHTLMYVTVTSLVTSFAKERAEKEVFV